MKNYLNGFLWSKKKYGPLAEGGRIGILALWKFRHDGGPIRASALTFTTTLSLVPFLILFFAVIKAVGAQRTLEPVLIEYFATNNQELARKIVGFVDRTDIGGLGIFGFLALCFTAIALLVDVEKAFNAIWGASSGRTLLRKITDYTAIMVACPILLLLSTSIVTTVRFREVFEGQMVQKALPLFLAFAPFAAKAVAFGAAYLIMPNHRVTFRSAAIGGLVAGAFWHAAEWLYITFQIKAGQSDAIYGALAQLPLFLIWVYIGWCVVLVGAQIACILDLPGRGRRLKGGEDLWMPRPGAFLPVMREIGRKFERGEELPTVEGIVDSLGLHPEEGAKVVNVLVSAGFLTLSGDALQKLLPARSPRSVTMAEVLAAVSKLEEEPAFAEEFIKNASTPFSSLTWAEWALEESPAGEKRQLAG